MRPHDCPELNDLPCAICERAINALESERDYPQRDFLADDYAAARYEREMGL